MSKIDFHTHYLTPGFIKFLDRNFNGFGDGVTTPKWSIETTLEYMETMNIEYAIPSISSPHINFGDKNETLELAQEVNEFGASMIKMQPDRLGFAATLPRPYVQESIKEIQRSLKVYKANAIALPTNSLGIYLGDPRLDPIMEELNKEKAMVMIHPNISHVRDKNVNKKLPLPIMEFFFDTTRAVLNMLENGIFTRYSDITFIIPYAGATLSIIADRVPMIGVLTKELSAEEMDLKKVMKNVYFDVAGMVLPRQLPMLLQLADTKKILYASDAPYTPKKIIVSLGDQLEYTNLLSEELKKDIFYNNGIALLKNSVILNRY